MKWVLVLSCALAASGLVACGQQLVDLPFEQNASDMGADQSVPVVIVHDMAHANTDAGETD